LPDRAAARPRGMILVDSRAILRKSIQAAGGLLLHIMAHVSLIQSLIPAFFRAPKAVFCLPAAAR
jgi:hypothetical protein